jgi:hypothetical protein
MKHHQKVTVICALLFVVLFASSILGRRRVEALSGGQATLDEVLYLPSGKAIKKLSLGYSDLLADIYWTRAVQYFGAQHIGGAAHYELLAPLLDITTDLDPNLIVAYDTGSIFLSQKRPDGAGQPDKAAALVEKGIRANPSNWRLYFTLGFIHFTDRHDPKAAQLAFQRGSEVPGALPWMKVMAARMAERADDPATAASLWQTIHDTTRDPKLKDTAVRHLTSLRVESELNELERLAQVYFDRHIAYPEVWSDLIRDGLLPGVPMDPTGAPYKLQLFGVVQVQNPKDFPYLERHKSPAK